MVVAVRHLSPDRIQPESILGRKFSTARFNLSNAKKRAGTLVSNWLLKGRATTGDRRSTTSPRNNRSRPHVSRIMPKSIPKTLSTARGTVSSTTKRASALVSNWLSREKGTARSHSSTGSLRSNMRPCSIRDRQSIRVQRSGRDVPPHNVLGLQVPSPTHPNQARLSAVK